MSVSITKMVEANRSFEASQLKAFQQFIDTSKELKGAIKTEQKEAAVTYNAMQSLIHSLQPPVPANGLSPISVLESDTLYMQALTDVVLLPADLYKPSVVISYMDSFMHDVDAEMEQRELNNE